MMLKSEIQKMDKFDFSQNGIIHKNIIDWLLDEQYKQNTCIKYHFLQTICVKHNLQGVDFFEKISKIRHRRSDIRRRTAKKTHGKNSNTTYTKTKIR